MRQRSREIDTFVCHDAVGLIGYAQLRWGTAPSCVRALRPAEVQRISDAIGRANAYGMRVILDIHNYGAYWLSDGTQGVRRAVGSAEVTVDHFATLWRMLSTSFRATPGLVGYGLMNEPVGMAAPSCMPMSMSAMEATPPSYARIASSM